MFTFSSLKFRPPLDLRKHPVLVRLLLPFVSGACLFWVSGASAIEPKEQYEDGWVLRLETRLNGKSQQTFSKSGYRNHHVNEGYTAVFAAPNWHMQMYNHNVPLLYEAPFKKFAKDWASQYRTISKMAVEVDLSDPWVNGKPVILNGQKATLYIVRSPRKVLRGRRLAYDYLYLYMSDEIVLPEVPAQFVSTYYGYKLNHHIPLRITEVYDHQEHIVMDTKSVRRKKVPLSIYKVPDGLRAAHSPFEIFMGGDASAIFSDMADQLGKRELKKK